MKILLSPAKSLDFASKLPTEKNSSLCFEKEAEHLNSILKRKTPKDLSELMGVSSKIANLNFERNHEWSLPFTNINARQAVYAFSGDVYRGLDAYSIDPSKIDFMQDSVRIISGLYGILKPLDLIQAYRLEMGTKLSFDSNKNLYDYWRKRITNQLNLELSENEPILNLASNEYFKAIDTKVIRSDVYSANFKQFKNGNYKTIAIFSKRARGMMTRYIIENNINEISSLKLFNLDGYFYNEDLSSAKDLVFCR